MGEALDWDVIVEQTRSRAYFFCHPDAGPVSPVADAPRPWLVDETDVTELGNFGLDDEVDVVQCDTCQKPVLRTAFPYHRGACFACVG
jgi:hypothetical protein